MRRAAPLLVLVLLGASGLTSEAQPGREHLPPARLAGVSPRAAGRLAAADARVEKRQWSDAIAELQALLDESADELIPVKPDQPDHSIAVRQVYPLRLAALPPPALKLYRARFDAQAQRWLEQAAPARDVAQLRRIVDEAFASRPAERAIDLLGGLALARGNFAEAQHWWRMLAVPATAQPGRAADLALRYPDPQIDPALVRAKLILTQLLAGERTAARAELTAFRTAHPRSAGLLAGREGSYAATLQAMLDRPDARDAPGLTDWPTFAGDAERNGVAASMPRVRWLEEPWRARLDGQPVQGALEPLGRIENPAAAARALTVHPVIVGRRVIVTDHHAVTVFDLLTGRRQARFDLLDDPNLAHVKVEPARQGERHTLTVAADRIYARLGSTAMGLSRDGKDGAAETVGDSFLVCLNLPQSGEQLAVQWKVPARTSDKDPALFEGAPLVAGGRAWIAHLRCQRNWSTTSIDCYDAQTGARRWRQEVCEGQEGPEEPRQRQQLLTLAGPHVVYCSHSGAVVALDAATGKRAWSMRYPRRGYRIANGFPSPRDLTPCLYADGRLYVAPTDAGALYCLDARTGRTLWHSRPLEVGHLLGVAKGQVIFTTAATPQGIRALDAATGADIRHWLHPSGGHDELPSLGRGILAGDKVIWPTIHGLRILDQEDGQVSAQDFVPLNGVRPGNIAVGSGCLVIATERELHGYIAPRHFLEQRRKDAAADPKSPAKGFRLALAEADAGVCEVARQVAQQASSEPRLRSQVLDLEHTLLLEQAARRAPGWEKQLAAAGDARFAADQQFTAWRQLAALDSIDAWQQLLGQEPLRTRLALAEGAERVAGWQQTHGPALAARQETAAREAMARHQGPVDDPFVRELARQFPFAPVTAAQLERLAQQYDKDGDASRAADLHRLRLRVASEPKQRAAASAALAQVYEKQGLRHRPAPALPELAVPLTRRWEVTGSDRVLAESPASDRHWFAARDDVLLCRDAVNGAVRWQCRWPFPVTWVGFHADLVLAAGPRGAGGCRLTDGVISWSLAPGAACSAFQIANGRLFLLLDECRIAAIDVETGLALWQQAAPGAELRLPAPGGCFHAPYCVAAERVLLQTGRGALMVLDARTGEPLLLTTPNDSARTQAPLRLSERQVCVIPDPQTIALVDRDAGKEAWRQTFAHRTTLSGEAPQMLGDAAALLVLVPRNYGYELERLDPATGKSVWPQPVLFRSHSAPQLALGALDRSAVYLNVGEALEARAVSDGRRLWRTALPVAGQRWQVIPTRHALLAVPQQATLAANASFLWRRWLGLTPGGLWTATTSAVALAQSPSRASVVVCDPKDGKVLQTLDFAGQGGAFQVNVVGSRVVVAMTGSVWGLQ